MTAIKGKPGVILLPVFAVLAIFIILLFLLIDQKQSNNALVLEYRATRIIDLLLELYSEDEEINSSEIDEDIIGYGIYDLQGNALVQGGSAPESLPRADRRNSEVLQKGNRSIIIIRQPVDGNSISPGMNMMMQRMAPLMQRRLDDLRQKRSEDGLTGRFQAGVYLEYANSSYIAELRLLIMIVSLFIFVFAGAFLLVYRLYMSNRRLLLKAEHDKQLIQLGEAARTLAHEIRNPLGALKIQRDILEKKLPGEYAGNLQVIDRELKRLNLLVERVGEFLRNPIGRPENINLGTFITELYGATPEVHIAESCRSGKGDFCVRFDRERLRTVIDNLVNNGVDSSGKVEISCSRETSGISLTVRDQGPGFTEEALARLYDPFFTTKNSGTGLGLSIVKRLIESAGGRVEIGNNPDGGAAAIIIFGENDARTDS